MERVRERERERAKQGARYSHAQTETVESLRDMDSQILISKNLSS